MKKAIDEFNITRKDYINGDGVVFKGVVNEKAYDGENRQARFIMSAESPDLMEDVVKQDGIDLVNFMKNPVALAFHNHRAPVGLWKDVEVVSGRPKRLEGTMALHEEGTTASVDEIANLLSVGGLKAVSIGFMPKEVEFIRDKDGVWTGGFLIPESILLECSVVSIPAQPVALMKDAGGDHKLLAETLEFVLDTYCEKTSGGLYVRKEFEDAYLAIKDGRKSAPKSSDHQMTINLDIDTSEAEAKVESMMSRFKKEFSDLFSIKSNESSDPYAEYKNPENLAIFKKSDDGEVTLKNGDWPKKSIINCKLAENDDCFEIDGDRVIITIKGAVAEYQIVGKADNGRGKYVDLISSSPIAPKEPALINGSRAKAMAKLTLIKSGLRDKGRL